MKQEAQQMFKTNNCTLLPNGIDMTKFQNVKISKESMLTSLNLTKESFIVGHVGRFANVKNHQFLIDLFPLIKERNPKAHLILIGSGRLESQVKKQVSDNNLEESVHFLGDRKDIPELMSVMDVFIFPSIYEGFGNVLIEAQAAGIKCIVSDTVPKEAIVTNLVTTIALDAPKENWLQAVTAIEGSEKVKDELEKHDINNVVSRLEALYLE